VAIHSSGAPRLCVILGGASEVLHSLVTKWKSANCLDDRASDHRLARLVLQRTVSAAVAPVVAHKVSIGIDFGGTPGLSIGYCCAAMMNLEQKNGAVIFYKMSNFKSKVDYLSVTSERRNKVTIATKRSIILCLPLKSACKN